MRSDMRRQSLSKHSGAIKNDCSGSTAVIFSLMLPALVTVSLSGIDFAWAMMTKSALQKAADTAAIAGGKELSMSDAKRENVAAVVEAMVKRTMAQNSESLVKKTKATPIVKAEISDDPLEVYVKISQPVDALIGGLFGIEFPPIEVSSVARVVGKPNICVLALDTHEPYAIWLVKRARLTGDECAVFSNSTSKWGLSVSDSASLIAQNVCSAGGASVSGSVQPGALTDCPQFEDPLANREEPVIGPCTFEGFKVEDGEHTLRPGTYCGGITILDEAEVKFEPGEYILASGMFRIDGEAKIVGEDVSFFLGPKSWLYFGKKTSIDLSARTTGPLAGLIFFGSRQQSRIVTHTVLSRNAHRLIGTIYFPNNSFIVDGDAEVGGKSAYTAIVARRVVLLEGPHLVLNSNYDQTNVPVPKGIRGAGQPVSLVK